MDDVLIGSEAVAAGVMSRARLRWNYRTVFPDVYVPHGVEPTMPLKAQAAYLWSRRRAVITGRAAAALHGAEWVDALDPVELLWANNHRPRGIVTRRERISADEITTLGGMAVASPARTAFDLGRHLARGRAVAHLDALARATGLVASDVTRLEERYTGARGIRRFREAIDLMDPGAQSPKETWLRLLLIDAGYPRPTTQIPIIDESGRVFAYLDMGWPERRIAVEYDGDQHRTDRTRYVWDERRIRRLRRLGWIHIKVIAEDRPIDIVARVAEAWAQREREAMVAKRPA